MQSSITLSIQKLPYYQNLFLGSLAALGLGLLLSFFGYIGPIFK